MASRLPPVPTSLFLYYDNDPFSQVYDQVLTNSWMFEICSTSDEVAKYRIWMRETYNEVFSALALRVSSPAERVREAAYSTCLAFLHAETVFVKVPRERSAELVEAVVLSRNGRLITRLAAEVSDLDWKYATIRAIEKVAKKHSRKDASLDLSPCVHQLLASIDVSDCFSAEHKSKKTVADKTMHHIRKAYNSTWIQFLKMPKSRELYHTILSSLHEKVIPFMQNPKLLIDFLVDSYDLGGTASLLALNSLFILITQYNLDYPEFYPKLYRMLTPDLYHTTYVTRFLSMLDMFLKSPLLPAYLVAAFVKRLARNSLQAPPHIIIMVLRLITNLTKLHPSVKRLVHRGPDHPSVREDPFRAGEQDPAQCGALESSLWELEVLVTHVCPAVPPVVKTLRKPTDEVLVELGLGKGVETTFKEYLKLWKKDPPLEFNEPTSFDKSGYSDAFAF